MFAVIFLKKRAKYLLEFLKQVQRHVAMRILNVDPVYSESDTVNSINTGTITSGKSPMFG